MTRLLNGAELAGFIKERHARQGRALQADKIFPKLAIVQAKDDPVINTYVRLKQEYGDDIGVEVEAHKIEQAEIAGLIKRLNQDDSVHGVIVQLPLADAAKTDETVNLVAPEKDVDALGEKSQFMPAAPMAILWLLSGYNIDLKGKRVLLVGQGRLVGEPLAKILDKSSVSTEVIGHEIPDLKDRALLADVIITATGQPALITADMMKPGAVVVDAGTSSEDGKTVGDLAPEVYQRDDLTLTPEKGGVGPLTVCALFENVLRAAQNA